MGIDLNQTRLDFASKVGVTQVINSSILGNKSLHSAIRGLPVFSGSSTPSNDARLVGPSLIVDTTGVPAVMEEGLKALSPLGKLIQITNQGPGSKVSIDLIAHMRDGVSFTGTIQGDADPYESIPRLIRWYRDGELPLDQMEKTFAAEKWEEALKCLHDGSIAKAVLLW